jgi:TatD DNase family protein
MLVRKTPFNPRMFTHAPQIGINLTDPIFRGEYHGTQRHEDDFEDVLQRGIDAGCNKYMVTGSDLKESEHAVEIAKTHRKSSCTR